jgi:hypothetical protein
VGDFFVVGGQAAAIFEARDQRATRIKARARVYITREMPNRF